MEESGLKAVSKVEKCYRKQLQGSLGVSTWREEWGTLVSGLAMYEVDKKGSQQVSQKIHFPKTKGQSYITGLGIWLSKMVDMYHGVTSSVQVEKPGFQDTLGLGNRNLFFVSYGDLITIYNNVSL